MGCALVQAFVCCGKRKGVGAGKETDDPRIFGLREASFSVVLLTYKREYILVDKACALLVRPWARLHKTCT